MNNPQRTSNAAIVAALLRGAMEPLFEQNQNRLEHGLITTANSSLFSQAHYSEPLTTYALGWKDPADYDALSDFIAPPVVGMGDKFEHTEYPNAEAFLAEVNGDDDLRAIYAEFKTVEESSTKTTRTIPNRGLRMVVDYDLVKNDPNWQTRKTGRLMQRIARNAARRKAAMALAAGAAVSKTWGTTQDPDMDVANQMVASGDITGIKPNRVLFGEAAQILRLTSYGSQATAAGFGGRTKSAQAAMSELGLGTLVDSSRIQTGVTKTSLIGSKVLLFSAYSQDGEDPSNFKTARGTTSQGGRWGVYIRQIGVKFWEITVECYEMEWVASTLGVRTITVS